MKAASHPVTGCGAPPGGEAFWRRSTPLGRRRPRWECRRRPSATTTRTACSRTWREARAASVEWARFIERLKVSGMPIREIKRYIDLYREGGLHHRGAPAHRERAARGHPEADGGPQALARLHNLQVLVLRRGIKVGHLRHAQEHAHRGASGRHPPHKGGVSNQQVLGYRKVPRAEGSVAVLAYRLLMSCTSHCRT